MNQVSSHKVGLMLGGVFAIVHAVWSAMVLVGIAQPFINWILGLHFLNFQYDVDPFRLWTALMLVVTTAIIGYCVGYVAGWAWNLAHRLAHGR